MPLIVLSGSAHPSLADAVASKLGLSRTAALLERHPDGELRVEVPPEAVRGATVLLVQPTSPPAETHLVELLLLADSCRRSGATRIVAALPYFAYARQDRRVSGREPIGARLVADLLATGRIDDLIAVDLHTRALEGVFSLPLEHVSAVPLLAREAAAGIPGDGVIVSPDLGGVKLAESYAKELKLPVAIVHKTRQSGSEVTVHGVVGDVRGKRPIITDDMVSTGGTVAAAVHALLDAGAVPEVTIVVSHAMLAATAVEKLKALPLKRFVTTDSIPHAHVGLPMKVVSLAPLIAEAMQRLLSGKT